MTIVELQAISAASTPLPDGNQLRIFALTPTAWATLPPETAVVMRVKGQADVIGGFIAANNLDRTFAPHLKLRQLLGDTTGTVKRRAIQELGYYELMAPAARASSG